MQKLVRREGLISFGTCRTFGSTRSREDFRSAYVFPASGTPVITDGIAIVRGAPNEEEAQTIL